MALLLKSNSLDKKRNTNKSRNAQPVRSKAGVRKSYEDDLLTLNNQQSYLIDTLIIMMQNNASPATISNFLIQAQQQSNLIYQQAGLNIASQFVARSSKANKNGMANSVKKSLNLDFAEILDNEEVSKALSTSIVENVFLIQSIPSEQWGKVAQAITQNFKGETTEETLIKRLQAIQGMTNNRAKFIARDQTSKVNGNLNKIRSNNIGINSFVWRTAKNEKVVGNPAGLYPKPSNVRVHGNHYEREGRVFYYDDPPVDGIPGQPINCNCYAEPRIVLNNLNVQYI